MRVVSAIFGFAFAVATALFIRQIGTALMGGDVYLYAPGGTLLLSFCIGLAVSCLLWRKRSANPDDHESPEIADNDSYGVLALCWFLAICGIILPATVILIRAVPLLFIEPVGPVYEIRRAIAMSILLLLPSGLSGGIALGLLYRVALEEEPGGADVDIVLIGGGGFVGGLSFSLLLADYAPPLQLAGAVGFLSVAAGFGLWLSRERGKGIWGYLMAPVAFVLFIVAIPPVGSVLDFAVTKIRLIDYVLLENRHSAFAEMDAVAPMGGRRIFEDADALGLRSGLPVTGEGRLFLFGGLLVGANHDIEHAEETAHLALALHPSPRNVLIIGGGASGVVAQALKHPSVERVDCVEIDPAFVAFVAGNSTGDLAEALGSSRVIVHEKIDGIGFMRKTGGSYDVIIVDIPDPTTGVFSRYYTVEFMRDVRARMADGGIATYNLAGGRLYMTPARRFLVNSVSRTFGFAFDDVSIIGGEEFHIFLMGRDDRMNADADIISRRLEERGVATQWLDVDKLDEYLPPISARFEGEFGAQAVISDRLNPLSYKYSVLYRPPRFDGQYMDRSAERWDLRHYGATVWFLAFAGAGLAIITRRRRLISCPALMLFTGCAASVLLVTFLMMFQAYYGTAYGYLALFIGVALLGLGVGVECGTFAAKAEGRRTFMLAATLALGGCALMLPSALTMLHDAFDAVWAGHLAFVAALALTFWLVGVTVPIARRCFDEGRNRVDGMIGMLFCLLLGAGIGALAAGALFVPFMGPAFAACVAAFMAFGGAAQFVLAE